MSSPSRAAAVRSHKLTLINVDSGNYLGHDGQAVALVHRDDGSGGVASRFAAAGRRRRERNGPALRPYFPGEGSRRRIVSVTKAAARNSKQQALPVITSGTIVHVQ